MNITTMVTGSFCLSFGPYQQKIREFFEKEVALSAETENVCLRGNRGSIEKQMNGKSEVMTIGL